MPVIGIGCLPQDQVAYCGIIHPPLRQTHWGSIETFEFHLEPNKSSFLRKQESSSFKIFWIPAGVYPRESGGGNDKVGVSFKGLISPSGGIAAPEGFFVSFPTSKQSQPPSHHGVARHTASDRGDSLPPASTKAETE